MQISHQQLIHFAARRLNQLKAKVGQCQNLLEAPKLEFEDWKNQLEIKARDKEQKTSAALQQLQELQAKRAADQADLDQKLKVQSEYEAEIEKLEAEIERVTAEKKKVSNDGPNGTQESIVESEKSFESSQSLTTSVNQAVKRSINEQDEISVKRPRPDAAIAADDAAIFLIPALPARLRVDKENISSAGKKTPPSPRSLHALRQSNLSVKPPQTGQLSKSAQVNDKKRKIANDDLQPQKRPCIPNTMPRMGPSITGILLAKKALDFSSGSIAKQQPEVRATAPPIDLTTATVPSIEQPTVSEVATDAVPLQPEKTTAVVAQVALSIPPAVQTKIAPIFSKIPRVPAAVQPKEPAVASQKKPVDFFFTRPSSVQPPRKISPPIISNVLVKPTPPQPKRIAVEVQKKAAVATESFPIALTKPSRKTSPKVDKSPAVAANIVNIAQSSKNSARTQIQQPLVPVKPKATVEVVQEVPRRVTRKTASSLTANPVPLKPQPVARNRAVQFIDESLKSQSPQPPSTVQAVPSVQVAPTVPESPTVIGSSEPSEELRKTTFYKVSQMKQSAEQQQLKASTVNPNDSGENADEAYEDADTSNGQVESEYGDSETSFNLSNLVSVNEVYY